MKRLLTILIFCIAAIALTTGEAYACRKVTVRQGMDLVKVFAGKDTKYVIKQGINLGGKIVKIGEGSTLVFKGGSISNGTLKGDFKLKGVVRNSLGVKFSDCNIAGEVPVYRSDYAQSLMSSCTEKITLCDDITITTPIRLRASIEGQSHTVTSTTVSAVAFYIMDQRDVTLNDITIIKQIPEETINQNYALNIQNSSNITVKNSHIVGRIHCVNKSQSDEPSDISENFSFLNSTLKADFTPCKQGWENGQDHLAFFSIKNVRIENCTIISKNVNRVLKTSAFFQTKDYPAAYNCTDGVLFKNNKVTAEAQIGKQFWDMFCGTVNVLIEKNDITLKGFTRFVEDKAFQPKYKGEQLISSTITIQDNSVYMNGGDLFQFLANSDVDNFVVKGNQFTLAGVNRHPITGDERTCGFYLQGYKSCRIEGNEFTWKDGAVGLMLGKVNFISSSTVIRGNTIQDAYRLYFATANHPKMGQIRAQCNEFVYEGNTKHYTSAYRGDSRSEIYVAQSDVKTLQLDFGESDAGASFLLEFGKESVVENLSANSNFGHKNLFRINNKQGTSITNVRAPAMYHRQGSEWRAVKQ